MNRLSVGRTGLAATVDGNCTTWIGLETGVATGNDIESRTSAGLENGRNMYLCNSEVGALVSVKGRVGTVGTRLSLETAGGCVDGPV